MTTLRNKQKLATLNKKKCKKPPWSKLAQNPNVPRSQEIFITQVYENIEGRATKKLSKDLNRTESRILGALSGLDEFFLHPLIQGHSGSAPETSRNTLGTNQERNEDDFQSDPHPEASVSQSQTAQNSGPDDAYDSCDCNWFSEQYCYEKNGLLWFL